MPTGDPCTGFTPDTGMTVPCPSPVAFEVRVWHAGLWHAWRPFCVWHTDGIVNGLRVDGWDTECRPIDATAGDDPA